MHEVLLIGALLFGAGMLYGMWRSVVHLVNEFIEVMNRQEPMA